MARVPDERRSETTLPRFDDLPVLTAYTALADGRRHVIQGCNEQFRDRLDRPESEVVDRPLRELYDSAGVPGGAEPGSDGRRGAQFDGGDVSADPTEPPAGDGPATEAPGASSATCAERDLIAADGRLVHTLAEVVPRAHTDAYAVFHMDTTRLERREKQVAALNRLLRHNVRNDLNLLQGYASGLRDHDDDEVAAAGRVIDRIADRWLGLAETGREIEQLSTATAGQTVALDDLLTSTRRAVEREHPSGTVCVEFDGVDSGCPVSEQWYSAIVELCENGIKHTVQDARDGTRGGGDVTGAEPTSGQATDGRESPTVTVTVRNGRRPGWVVIAVADEGPGIPPDERVTLRGGTETALRHGSGLGTWLVRFVAEEFGGRVSVDDRKGGGSVVRLHLPVPDDGPTREHTQED